MLFLSSSFKQYYVYVTVAVKTIHVSMQILTIFQSLKSHISVTAYSNVMQLAHSWLNDQVTLLCKVIENI